jgi:hypothetical protein
MDEILLQIDEPFLLNLSNVLLPLLHGVVPLNVKLLDEMRVVQRYQNCPMTSVASILKPQRVEDELSALVRSTPHTTNGWRALKHNTEQKSQTKRKLAMQLVYPLHMFEPPAARNRDAGTHTSAVGKHTSTAHYVRTNLISTQH